jgi:hypothetical protein
MQTSSFSQPRWEIYKVNDSRLVDSIRENANYGKYIVNSTIHTFVWSNAIETCEWWRHFERKWQHYFVDCCEYFVNTLTADRIVTAWFIQSGIGPFFGESATTLSGPLENIDDYQPLNQLVSRRYRQNSSYWLSNSQAVEVFRRKLCSQISKCSRCNYHRLNNPTVIRRTFKSAKCERVTLCTLCKKCWYVGGAH